MTDRETLTEAIEQTREDIAALRAGDMPSHRDLAELRGSLARLVKTRSEVEYQVIATEDLRKRLAAVGG